MAMLSLVILFLALYSASFSFIIANASSPLSSVEDGLSEAVLSFEDTYSVIWGMPTISNNGNTVQLKLDQDSGAGFMSQDDYMHGFFSASVKLPPGDTAGIVIALYTSNSDRYPSHHDELDFEFLGNVPGKDWALQTNIYGNGSVSRGREERFNLWFDPTLQFHNYTIMWTPKNIMFVVDDIPIRRMRRQEELGGDYPSKPMALYATIWDGSGWATDGGKYPVNYQHGPFLVTFKNMKMLGCSMDPTINEPQVQCKHDYADDMNNLEKLEEQLLSPTPAQMKSMEWVRNNYMYYSYCDDEKRYPTLLPECNESIVYHSSIKKARKHRSRTKRTVRARGRARTLYEKVRK